MYAELTLENITLTKGATPSNHIGGAGVYVNSGGTLIMQGSSTITNCKAGKGGGVHVSGETEMTDCTVTGNTATSGGGGGIFSGQNAHRMYTCTLTENNAQTGGGICVAEDSFFMQHCTLTGNTAQEGGGVSIAASAQFRMDGSSTITPSTGNDINKPGKNDVYFEIGYPIATITVDDPLTPQGGIAARITVPNDNYQTGTKVLAGDKVGTEYTKFVVTPNGNKRWTVKSDGTLSNTLADIFANITKDQIEAAIDAAEAAHSTVYKEGDSINPTTILNGKLILYKTGKRDYGIMHVTEVNNTSNGGSGHIKFNYKTFITDNSSVKKENDKVVTGGDRFDLDTGNVNVNGSDFYLDNTTSQKWFKVLDYAKFYILPN